MNISPNAINTTIPQTINSDQLSIQDNCNHIKEENDSDCIFVNPSGEIPQREYFIIDSDDDDCDCSDCENDANDETNIENELTFNQLNGPQDVVAQDTLSIKSEPYTSTASLEFNDQSQNQSNSGESVVEMVHSDAGLPTIRRSTRCKRKIDVSFADNVASDTTTPDENDNHSLDGVQKKKKRLLPNQSAVTNDEAEKKWQCKYDGCGTKYKDKWQLQKHERIRK